MISTTLRIAMLVAVAVYFYLVLRLLKKKSLNLKYTLLDHKRRVVNDEVVEEIWLELYSVNSKGEFDTEYRQKFVINEYRFPNLVAAPKYRRQWLIDLAKNIMPEI